MQLSKQELKLVASCNDSGAFRCTCAAGVILALLDRMLPEFCLRKRDHGNSSRVWGCTAQSIDASGIRLIQLRETGLPQTALC